MLESSLGQELAESADHLSVYSFRLDPDSLDAFLKFNDRLFGLHLVARSHLTGTVRAFGFVTRDRLREVVELPLHLFHLVNDRHILFNQVFLRLADLGNKSVFPVLHIVLLVRCTHQLLLHSEVADVLLLEGVHEEFDSCFAVLALHERG